MYVSLDKQLLLWKVSPLGSITVLVDHIMFILSFPLPGISYHEKCYCPVSDMEEWLEHMQCPQSYTQIENDLAIFNDTIDMKAVAQQAVARFNRKGSHSLCHYVIKDNKVLNLEALL